MIVGMINVEDFLSLALVQQVQTGIAKSEPTFSCLLICGHLMARPHEKKQSVKPSQMTSVHFMTCAT